MEEQKTVYIFHPADHGFFAEIYFPRKSAHHGTIFRALRRGYKEKNVKRYLKRSASKLLRELCGYPRLFDPIQYDKREKPKTKLTENDSRKRIELYQSPFKGWSLYQVDGVFFDEQGKDFEEATRVVRILFRFQSKHFEPARKLGCLDIFRAIVFWAITKQDLLDKHNLWDKKYRDEFFERHQPWPNKKLEFFREYFTTLVREVQKWIDDCALFIFGYLVRQFSESVLRENLPEEEIWVTSFFSLTVNIIKRIQR